MNSTAQLPVDEDGAPRLLGVYWGLFPLSVVLLVARFFVRTRLRMLGWDDWFMLAAWVGSA